MTEEFSRVESNIAIVTDHIDGLYGYAVVLTHNRAEAEDLVQETYVRALEAVSRLRRDSNIKGWLFTILRNLWFNELRRRRSTPILVEIDGDESSAKYLTDRNVDAYEILRSKHDSEVIQAAINDLPLEFKEVILLREFEDLSYQEIAEVVGCPAGTVMSRLGRARERLRKTLLGTRPYNTRS